MHIFIFLLYYIKIIYLLKDCFIKTVKKKKNHIRIYKIITKFKMKLKLLKKIKIKLTEKNKDYYILNYKL